MKPDLLRRIYWQLLLLVSSNRYEKSRATHAGISFPTGFDATQSIFIHIPKTGGVSIAAALYGVLIPHYTWQEWRRVNPTKFKRYFKFAVLRDPVTRFASSFDFLKAGGISATDQEFSRVELADFNTANDFAKALADPGVASRILSECHFTPQTEFVVSRSGRLKVDRLISFENLHAGFGAVARLLGSESMQLPHLNKTPQRRELRFDDEARAVLDRVYASDFNLWREQAR